MGTTVIMNAGNHPEGSDNEGADLGRDYKAVRIDADLPILHAGSENTGSHRRTPSQ